MLFPRPPLFTAIGVLFLATFLVATLHADDITVSPMRVVFDEGEREAEVTIVNVSDDPGTYRISLMNYVQTRSEGMTEVTESTAKQYNHFANNMIRFSPRQVDLPPRGTQVVRLQLRLPPKLKPGEYRTHLAITNIPPPTTPAALKGGGAGGKKRMRVALTVVHRLAIPIVIRRGGNEEVKYGIKDVTLDITKNNTPAQLGELHFTLEARGSRSSFSDIEVTFRPEKELEDISIARLSAVAIYYPNQERDMIAQLTLPPQVKRRKGRLTITVKNPDNDNTFVAQSTLDIPTKP